MDSVVVKGIFRENVTVPSAGAAVPQGSSELVALDSDWGDPMVRPKVFGGFARLLLNMNGGPEGEQGKGGFASDEVRRARCCGGELGRTPILAPAAASAGLGSAALSSEAGDLSGKAIILLFQQNKPEGVETGKQLYLCMKTTLSFLKKCVGIDERLTSIFSKYGSSPEELHYVLLPLGWDAEQGVKKSCDVPVLL
ncbi:hypothetical protein DV515_00000538 [Chloebia gouldiae]|uniref:Uncharacterized protein n=1 Tax=Chloebia gouldiae TaxID=44316 RepID=A0A3L8T1U2_CHLGU|nr:hypothetical protein DV515_00000538 [Chloebia gouldiae]